MDPPPRTSSESEAPLIESTDATVSDPAAQHPPRRQGAPPEQATRNVASAPKSKGNEICCPSNGRNICVSADGTLGDFGEKNSNVVELQSRIIKDEKQLTYYISGIGTYGESDLRRWWDSAVASSFQRNVLKAYKWLCNSYKPGDRIFLFGFSRGAYQVRVIAGMIELVGLVYKGNHSQLPSVFKLYMKTMAKSTGSPRTSGKESDALLEARKQCETFKKAFSRPNVKVHFVGAWDTVSSIGITRGPCLPETTTGMAHVCHFRQALALDERRVRFWPEYANESGESSPGGDAKEVWFAGSHSDIGGWNTLNKGLDSFGPALRWMTYEAMKNGLRMEQHTKGWTSLTPKPSLKGLWHILEYLPLYRPSYKHGMSRRPHNGAPRQIQPRQRIHKSVFEAMGVNTDDFLDPETSFGEVPSANIQYKPLARFHDKDDTWNDIHRLVRERLEDDPFTSADFAVQKLKNAIGSDEATFEAAIQVLKNHVLFSESRAIGNPVAASSERQYLKPLAEVSTEVSDILLSILKREVERKDKRPEVITVLLSALAIVPPNQDARLEGSTLRNIVADLQGDESKKSYRQVVRRYRHNPLHKVYTAYGCAIEYVAFRDNEDVIYTGSYDAVGILDYNTSVSRLAVTYDHNSVDSVEVSGDGSRCVTGHTDGSVQWWDTETGVSLLTLKPKENLAWVRIVTISSDTRMIASGSTGGIIRIWATETGEDLYGPMEGHMDWINEVAFSSDGSQLASASDDHTIRLWDTSNGQHLKVLNGHTNAVWSATFSPCATQIISASSDTTVCIWDTVSGELMKKLEGHTQWVYYAVLSPDQNFVASGSGDGTVRVWDRSSGETLIVYDTGHPVRAVAFSGDGKKVISGSDNGDAYIWDASFLL